ncbi:uncharacterized protein LOC106168282 [Lingula anatina]|uniref:Uncharacterized protein LOC106168282 n=1 Tax=Lingula anatina TaxID=7574 RepID=A0A1S3IX16_LINAN|nr:uncharacterized protein LOC106168282 [Lingula anatina]|eukprot:XP_013402745.1 uncharacterized protein LOC106168282 [Lingula anatina]
MDDIPVHVILTKVDKVSEDVADDPSLVFHSPVIEKKVKEIGDAFGIQSNHVQPVKNYESETSIDPRLDILAFNALKQMTGSAEDYIEDQLRIDNMETNTKISKLNITLPSCTEWKRFNSTSGVYWVDPDGGGGVAAFEVYCDMSTTPPTVTFHHDYEDRTHVNGHDGAYSYSKSLAYKNYHSIGCWTDSNPRAIATLEGSDSNLDGAYSTRSNPIYKCYLAAKSRGYTYFAVQAGGWCASTATAGDTYDKYGPSGACNSDGEGGGMASEVYKIVEASVDQVAAYVDYVGTSCSQYIKYECYHSLINGYGGWYDRHGQKAPFWGGGDPDGTSINCACAQDGSCADSSKECNCDKNDNVWRSDEGYITESSYLPISMIKFGDTGGGEEGYHTVGPLTCYG